MPCFTCFIFKEFLHDYSHNTTHKIWSFSSFWMLEVQMDASNNAQPITLCSSYWKTGLLLTKPQRNKIQIPVAPTAETFWMNFKLFSYLPRAVDRPKLISYLTKLFPCVIFRHKQRNPLTAECIKLVVPWINLHEDDASSFDSD